MKVRSEMGRRATTRLDASFDENQLSQKMTKSKNQTFELSLNQSV